MSLRVIPLNRGGYDKQGRYWGVGQLLYAAEDMDTGEGTVFRAKDRSDALEKIKSGAGSHYKRRY